MPRNRPTMWFLSAVAIVIFLGVLLAFASKIGVAVLVVIMAGLPALYRVRHHAAPRRTTDRSATNLQTADSGTPQQHQP